MLLKLYSSIVCCTLTLLLLLCTGKPATAYSVLTHQAIVDAAWKTEILPLLKHRYPNAIEEELKKAHAHAYGGSIMQDMGYFPFGNTFFTDLVHYVRSGDFVENMLQESTDMYEFAFSLGALAHYNADIYGHPLGTNKAVALVYPKVGQEHGEEVTYADDAISHIKTEFGFDILQLARGSYAPQAYQDFIGFEVSVEVLERAFLKTYGLELGDVFVNVPLAVSTYRYTIRGIFPDLTKATWQAKQKDIRQAQPSITRRTFMYRMSRADFNKQWGSSYERPKLFARVMAWFIRAMPKVGPFRSLGFKVPTPEAEKLFLHSFNTTVDNYSTTLRSMRQHIPELQNLQLDTGKPTTRGAYKLTDETYAALLERLSKKDYEHVTPALQQHILQFYKQDMPLSQQQELKEKEREELQEQLEKLQTLNI